MCTKNKLISFKKNKFNIRKGRGELLLPDNRHYYGDIIKVKNNYFPYGHGKLDFHNSWGNAVDDNIHQRMSFYIGEFDYRVAGSIYGNGIMYYESEEHEPTNFVKGFFREHFIIGNYKLKFDKEILDKDYSIEDEFLYNSRKLIIEQETSKFNDLKKVKTLFLGDSYFELFKKDEFTNINSYDLYPNSLNLGVGGWTFKDYTNYLKSMPVFQGIDPEFVIINLGFNDVHINIKPRKVMKDFIYFNLLLKTIYKNSKFIYFVPIKAPLFKKYDKDIDKFDKLFIKYLNKKKIIYINLNDVLLSINKNDYKDYFLCDEAHPSKIGYDIYSSYLNKYIKP